MKEFERRLDLLIAVLGILAVAALLMMSCQSARYASVPERHTTVALQRDSLAARDSIFVHDSIVRREVVGGDTVTVTEHHWHTAYRDRWRDRVRVDTFIERDTVTVVREVEKPPGDWQRLRQRICYGVGGVLAGCALACACVIYIRRRSGTP